MLASWRISGGSSGRARRFAPGFLALTIACVGVASTWAPVAAAKDPNCTRAPSTASTGHRYKVVCRKDVRFKVAKAAAANMGGHLATISDATENQFIFDLANFDTAWRPNGQGQTSGPWIGLKQAKNGVEPAGGWGWITHEAYVYTNWAPSEPNNYLPSGSNENRGMLWDNGSGRMGWWNDVPNKDGATNSFVVEWEH